MKYKVGDKVRVEVPCTKIIVITTDGKETVAKMYSGKNFVKTATAKCSPDDTFNFKIGAHLAFNRLFEKEVKQDNTQYYTGKVVCTKNKYPHRYSVHGFTVGKIYDVVDGRITTDDGITSFQYRSLTNLCNSTGNTFIPLVEQ